MIIHSTTFSNTATAIPAIILLALTTSCSVGPGGEPYFLGIPVHEPPNYNPPGDASQTADQDQPEPYEVVDEPYFAYGDIYYFQDHGRYYYSEHGHRRYVSSLPAGGRRVSSRDGHPARFTPGPHQQSASRQPKPDYNQRPNQPPAGPVRQNDNRPQGGGTAAPPQPQVRATPAPAKAQSNTPAKKGKNDKDQQH